MYVEYVNGLNFIYEQGFFLKKEFKQFVSISTKWRSAFEYRLSDPLLPKETSFYIPTAFVQLAFLAEIEICIIMIQCKCLFLFSQIYELNEYIKHQILSFCLTSKLKQIGKVRVWVISIVMMPCVPFPLGFYIQSRVSHTYLIGRKEHQM